MRDMETIVDWAFAALIMIGILCIGVMFVGATVGMVLKMFS